MGSEERRREEKTLYRRREAAGVVELLLLFQTFEYYCFRLIFLLGLVYIVVACAVLVTTYEICGPVNELLNGSLIDRRADSRSELSVI